MATATLVQNIAGEVIVYVETLGGTPALELTTSDVSLNLKKTSTSSFFNKTQTQATNASVDIGSGTDGTVTLYSPGTAGNTYTVQVLEPSGTHPLNMVIVGTAITINLAVSSGVGVDAANTATLIAELISNDWTAGWAVASGTGEDPLSAPEASQPLVGGTDGTFINLGNGFYSLGLNATDTNTVGSLYLSLRGPGLRPSLEVVTIVASLPATPPVIDTPGTTLITGTVVSMGGNPSVNVSVSAKILSIPSIVAGVAVTTETVYTKTDSNGQFILQLLTGAQVDIIIPAVNYRRTITVPSSSVNLFDIP